MQASDTTETLALQAQAFGNYIVRQTPTNPALALYVKAMKHAPSLTTKEQVLLAFMLRRRWSIGCIDGALVFSDPHGELRRRLYVMFAILEATPEYSDYFLPRQRSPFYLLAVAFAGVRAIVRAIVGMVILKVVK